MELITSDPIAVGFPYGPGHKDAIALAPNGRVYVVYRRLLPNSKQELHFMYRFSSGGWSGEIRLPMNPSSIPHAGVYCAPNDNTPHFFFLDGENYKTSYIEHGIYDTLIQRWLVDTVALTERDYWHSGANFSVDADSLGGFHVVWDDLVWNDEYQQEIDRVTYAENTSGTWRSLVIADVGYTSKIQVEPNGRAHIKYAVRQDDHSYVIVATNRSRGDDVWTADSVDYAPNLFKSLDFRRDRGGTYHLTMSHPHCPPPWCWTYALYYTRRAPGATGWDELIEIFSPTGGGQMRLDC